ncbi:MAG: hypothetical protein H6577_09275 [Lewinellaceae bacterium]|nr:hypothetical protein [Saprospiraceae bacterium]MCB9338306.1 hypothetical protein [Lewinellaceae bacterium]
MKLPIHLLFLLLPLSPLLAQKDPTRVLGKPAAFFKPVELKQEEINERFNGRKNKDYSGEVPWIVFADHDLAQTYDQPEAGRQMRGLPFKNWFYVAEEDDDMIRIGRGELSGLKVEKGTWDDFGWVKKSQVLLWANSLVDARTGIHKKAFLLNKVNDIEQIKRLEKKEIVKIFNDPFGGSTIGNKTIYEFYFIYKKENDRFLIAKDAVLTSRSAEESLVGWVPASRVAEWNTRIALEPNFTAEAFAERKANPGYRVAAYGNEEYAQNHVDRAAIQVREAYWANDPAGVPPAQLATSNPRRFKGGVMRFPMLNDNGDYYRTGVIGDITVKTMSEQLDKINEINYSGIVEANEHSRRARDNYNILLVVEGTPVMEPYRQSLVESVSTIRRQLSQVPNVRFSVAVYRDVPEEEKGKLFDILPLTADQDKVISFINDIEFARWYDNDPWTAMYYGVHQAVLEAGLKKEDTNILILVGENGDYRGDRLRRAKNEGDKTAMEASTIVDKLCALNIHFIALQCRNLDERPDDVYARQCRNFILENSKCQHDLIRGVPEYIPEIQIVNPDIPEVTAGNVLDLKGGTTVGTVYRARQGAGLSREEYLDWLVQATNNVFNFTEKFWDTMSRIVNDGNSIDEVSSGAFTPAIAKAIKQFYEGSSKKQWTEKDIINMANQKYKLYAEVFVPKHIRGAKFDAFSYVLFMPRNDLEDYLNTLRRLAVASEGPPDVQREQLFNTLVELLKQFTGDASLRNNDPKNTSVESLRQIMQGVAKEGLRIGDDLDNFMISDFLNKRKMSDEKVNAFIKRILNNTEVLSDILKAGRSYEFLYTTGNESYFWVPVEYTF